MLIIREETQRILDILFIILNLFTRLRCFLINDESSVEAADYVIPLAGLFQLGKDTEVVLQDGEKQFLSTLLHDELGQQGDSVLCRELHKYSNMNSIDETLKALELFNRGLCG